MNKLRQHRTNIFTNSQLKKEKDKAERIMEVICWKSKFEEAEKYTFFNGTIRFLYLNGSTATWDDFNTEFSVAKVLFGDNNTVFRI